jgi:ribose transport system substrate-binding protein
MTDVDVVLSNADQHLVGVEIALEAAGMNPADLYLSGGGAAAIAIDGDPRRTLGFDRWPISPRPWARSRPMEQIANAIEGKPVTQSINMDEAGPIEAMIDAAVLEANPDFTGEWEQ